MIPFFFSHIFPWPIIYVGGSFAYTATGQIIRAIGSRRWKTVEGKVTKTSIEVTDTGGDYPHDLYAPLIEYRYDVDGESKTSRKLAMADINPGGKARAEAMLKHYKTGSKVRIYLSPQGISILEPGLRWPLIGKLIFGLLFLGAGVTMLIIFGGLGPLKG